MNLRHHMQLHSLDASKLARLCKPIYSVSEDVINRALKGLPITRNKAESICDALSAEHGLPRKSQSGHLTPEDVDGLNVHDPESGSGAGTGRSAVPANPVTTPRVHLNGQWITG